MTEIAYVVQSHTRPRQVDALVARLLAQDPRAVVLVSHDRAGPPLLDATTRRGRVRTSLDIGGRGRFHNVRRWLDAVAWLRAEHPVDFVVTVTGQDYPVRPAGDLHDALRRSGDGLVEHFPALDGSAWRRGEGRTRYLFGWYDVAELPPSWGVRLRPVHVLNHTQPFVRVNVAYGALRLGRRRWSQPFGADLQPWAGSFFTNVSWRSVEHVLDVVAGRPDLLRWGEESLLAEEGFLQSILLSAPRLTFGNSSGRYYDFRGSRGGSPTTLTVEDVPTALASGAFFARKWGDDFLAAYAAVDSALDGGAPTT